MGSLQHHVQQLDGRSNFHQLEQQNLYSQNSWAHTAAAAALLASHSHSANSRQSNMLILQESCTNSTGSYVIYAPVDIVTMNVVLNGGDPDYVALLPSGFAILPDGPYD
ncbi:hypothetical protein ACLOJK_027210 [Asimina triloba]